MGVKENDALNYSVFLIVLYTWCSYFLLSELTRTEISSTWKKLSVNCNRAFSLNSKPPKVKFCCFSCVVITCLDFWRYRQEYQSDNSFFPLLAVLRSEIRDLRLVLQSSDKELATVKNELSEAHNEQQRETSQLSNSLISTQLQLDKVQ